MKQRKFGKTGANVPILGFGCMRFPTINNNYGQIDEEKSISMLRYAIDNGVNYLDSGYTYHEGNSELLIAKALKDGYREKALIATKLPSWEVKSRQDMDRLIDDQLRKLEVEVIDFYLVHAINKSYWENLTKHNIFEFLDSIKKAGKVKHIGFSFHDDINLFKEIVDSYDWEFCQIQYNYLDENYQAGKTGLEYAAKKDLGIVIMEPLRGGTLANNIPDDMLNILNKDVESKRPVEWALKWLWNDSNIHILLSGMSTMEQLEDNIKIANSSDANSLSEKEILNIKEAKDFFLTKVQVHCTNCQYCMPCPAGVFIPECFRHLNNFHLFDDQKDAAKFQYGAFVPEDARASKCVECGKCEEHCPQNIPIIKMLKEVVKTFDS